jgi:hypothetical protein
VVHSHLHVDFDYALRHGVTPRQQLELGLAGLETGYEQFTAGRARQACAARAAEVSRQNLNR